MLTSALEESPLLRIILSARTATQDLTSSAPIFSLAPTEPALTPTFSPAPTEPAPAPNSPPAPAEPSPGPSPPPPAEATQGRSLRSQTRKGSPKKQTGKRVKVNGARYTYVDPQGNEVDIDTLV